MGLYEPFRSWSSLGLIFVRLRLLVPRLAQGNRGPWYYHAVLYLERKIVDISPHLSDPPAPAAAGRRPADRLPSRREVSRDLGPPRRKLVDVQSIDAVRMYVAPSDELGPRLIGQCPLRFADDESGDSRRRLI